ncbi:hybrid sensor histidine kinase/response regulator [Pantanalinema sp. GBBB05]|uniref:hybrid sensor histidine kinase/response regulator n=1 Tax=Pantanalinema sp. GBBB05 TaxID=2604139 RepID=UPI003D814A27
MSQLQLTSHTNIANILLVDDTPDNLRLLAKMLESQGYKVRKTTSGRMALQSAHREPPDLILLDINMPEMNGYEVCQQLKQSEATQQIPVIFISALDQLGDKVRAFDLGGLDYITKPFQEQEVLVRVRNQLLIQQQKRQLIRQNQQLQQEIQERQRAEAEIRQLNANLEQKVYLRTLELQQSLNFEATLKRISDKVRDSLDSHQILQSAVEELAKALEVHCCDAVLYSPDRLTSTIRYQHVQPGLPATQGQTLFTADVPELYEQLQQKFYFAFCQIQPSPIRNHSAILACPIFDDQVEQQGTLGDLWLFKPLQAEFIEPEIHLVEQVANQCAIALRQARLYEAAQAQVQELQRLNQLKDDFLYTISHELRTPIANIKQVIEMLTILTNCGRSCLADTAQQELSSDRVEQYFSILQEECDRELELVEDLLKLQHLEAGIYPIQPTTVNLRDWIPHVLEPFQMRIREQQQQLHLRLAERLPAIAIDLPSLGRIIKELINNACKYTPPGERITLTANWIDGDITSNSAPTLLISVSNTGVEIAETELSRIFDKFYRIPNHDPWKYGGTGLGLALVKKMVEQLNGRIWVESANNLTCLTVALPL